MGSIKSADQNLEESSTNGATIASTSQENEATTSNPYTITTEILQERLLRPNSGRYSTQLFVSVSGKIKCTKRCLVLSVAFFTASLAALSFGAALGWSSPTNNNLMIQLQLHYNQTASHYGWVTSIMPLGCSLGIMPWSYAVHRLGPKHALMLLVPFYILTFLVMITVKTTKTYFLGRFVSGTLSIANMIGGEYLLVDTVHRKNLRHMIVFFRSSVLLGVFLSYLMGHFLTKFWLMIVCVLIPTVNAFFLLFMPESPVFLYNKSESKAVTSLSWYRGHANIYTEIRLIKKDAEIRKCYGKDHHHKYMLFSKVVVKALAIVMGLTFFQVFCGYYALLFYNQTLWGHSDDVFTPIVDTLIFGVCLYASNFVGNMVHYNVPFGVRKPLLLSTSLITATLVTLALFFYLYELDYPAVKKMNWVPLTMFNSFIISYEIGLGSYTDILLLQYLPYQVHDKAKSIIQISFWFQVFLVTKYFITIQTYTAYFMPFAIWAAIAFFGIIYCYVFIIETQGKTLMQIQIEIGGNPIGNRGAYRNHMRSTTGI